MPAVVFRKGSTRIVSGVVEFSGSGVTLASSGGVAVVTISGGGGGSSDHATLSHLAWTSSGHTGTASRLAYFGSGGAAAELSVGTGLVVSGSALAVDTATIATVASLSGYVPISRAVNTSAPLSGGGALSSDVTLSLSGWSGTTDGQPLYRSGGSVATATVSSPLIWSGGALGIQAASASQAGALSASDWSTFNGKVGTSRTISTSAPLTGGGDLSADRTIAIPAATSLVNGYLTSTDWSTFNGKEPAISAGTTSQYWRGDKSWQTLNKSAVGLPLVENTALSTWAGTTNVTTLGTVATGVWHGSTIGVGYGGTGLASYTSGALLYASNTTTLAALSIGSAGNLLGVSGGLPAWLTQAQARTVLALTPGIDVQAYDADLTALAALSTTGFACRIAADTWALRTLTSTGGTVTITNPGGVAGNINIEASGGNSDLDPTTGFVISVAPSGATLSSWESSLTVRGPSLSNTTKIGRAHV